MQTVFAIISVDWKVPAHLRVPGWRLLMLARLVVHRVRAPGKCTLDSAATGSMRLYRCIVEQSE